MIRAFVVVCLCSMLTGCASIHSGKYAEEGFSKSKTGGKVIGGRNGLIVSGEENQQLASEHFAAFDFAFENTTSKWIRIKSASIDFGDAAVNDKVKIIVGRDLVAWSEASAREAAISSHNTAVVLGAIAAVGAATAMSSQDPNVAKAGAYTFLGSSAALSVTGMLQRRSEVEKARVVPESHLYSQDFIVPPKLHTKKWVAIYTEEPFAIPFIQKIIIRYQLETGETDTATIPFRDFTRATRWQKGHPDIKKLKAEHF